MYAGEDDEYITFITPEDYLSLESWMKYRSACGEQVTKGVSQNYPPVIEHGARRHEFKTDHGFRKWYKTQCEIAGMKPINIEILMGHSVGISDSYTHHK